jgi:hypothetical protein
MAFNWDEIEYSCGDVTGIINRFYRSRDKICNQPSLPSSSTGNLKEHFNAMHS